MGPGVSVTDYEVGGRSSIPHWDRYISTSHHVQTVSEVTGASYPMSTDSSFFGGKVAEA
jgi:hypothetical protein